jgi:hypothetical protein
MTIEKTTAVSIPLCDDLWIRCIDSFTVEAAARPREEAVTFTAGVARWTSAGRSDFGVLDLM